MSDDDTMVADFVAGSSRPKLRVGGVYADRYGTRWGIISTATRCTNAYGTPVRRYRPRTFRAINMDHPAALRSLGWELNMREFWSAGDPVAGTLTFVPGESPFLVRQLPGTVPDISHLEPYAGGSGGAITKQLTHFGVSKLSDIPPPDPLAPM